MISIKTLFLFTDAYTIRTVLLCSDYLFNNSIKKIIIMGESFSHSEVIKYSRNICISIINDIDECIRNSDIIIIDTHIPFSARKYVTRKSKQLSKECYVLSADALVNNDSRNNLFNGSNAPYILVVSLGTHSQSSLIEVLLTKILEESGVDFCIEYTMYTFELLETINSFGGLQMRSFPTQKRTIDDGQVFVGCVQVDNLAELYDKSGMIKSASPDFVILSSDMDLLNSESINNFFNWACLTELDMIIKSHYHTAASKYAVYCDKLLKTGNGIYDIESNDLLAILFNSITRKMAFPKGMIPNG